jgi:hypothetical protein
MSTATHTPTPWFAQGKLIVGATPDDGQIGAAYDLEDAAHIVLCVNAHDDLVAALRAMLIVYEHGECEAMHPDVAENMARAALAEAQGGEG